MAGTGQDAAGERGWRTRMANDVGAGLRYAMHELLVREFSQAHDEPFTPASANTQQAMLPRACGIAA